jgi:hypothetical protein
VLKGAADLFTHYSVVPILAAPNNKAFALFSCLRHRSTIERESKMFVVGAGPTSWPLGGASGGTVTQLKPRIARNAEIFLGAARKGNLVTMPSHNRQDADALEKHYSVKEIAESWGVPTDCIRDQFRISGRSNFRTSGS